jgi:serine/threonine protein kinase
VLNEIRDLKPGMVVHQSYRIVRKLGQGGMGTVYLARHILMDEPVALKFLSTELSSDTAFTNRFLREVRTLRQVRHKNVVDANSLEPAEDGSLFFSMEFVDGPNLRELMNQAAGPLDVELALAITRGIAEGLGAAHAKGMVHRDIKPANILMAREGDAWVPKIADFGIVATKENRTIVRGTTGGSLLTYAYAAPEQWRGMRSAELDGRTDLYALGGVLFEMLTGQTVFDDESYEGWAEQHRNVAPSPPSSLRPELANWKGLDALVLSMLAKDRDLRPKNITELLGLLDAIVYIPAGQRQETVREDLWKRQDTVVEDHTVQPEPTPVPEPVSPPQLVPPIPPVEPDPGKTGMKVGGWLRRSWVLVLVVVAVVLGVGVAIKLGGPKPVAEPGPIPTPVADVRTLLGHPDPVSSIAFSPDGRRLASGSFDYRIKLWNVASGEKIRTLSGHTNFVRSVAFSPDGRTLASASDDHSIKLWDVASGNEIRTLQGHTGGVLSVAFSPDGRLLASGSSDESIKLWDVASGNEIRTLQGYTDWVFSVAFSPDGRTLASGSNDLTINLWDVASGKQIRTLHGHTGSVLSVAFSPDGRTLASGSNDNIIKLWNVASGYELRTLQGHTKSVFSVAFSPDGRALASGSADHTIKLCDVASGKEIRTLQGHTDDVESVAFSPDGRTLASGSADKTIKLWDVSKMNQ